MQINKLDVGENKTRVAVVSLADEKGIPEVMLNDHYNKQDLLNSVKWLNTSQMGADQRAKESPN